jgi:hypothetical protein
MAHAPRSTIRFARGNVRESSIRETSPLTYAALCARLGIAPPRQIRKLVLCLEALMREQAGAGEPLSAALVASKVRDGLPAPGFFALARELGCYSGSDESGAEARAWHDAELARIFAQYDG